MKIKNDSTDFNRNNHSDNGKLILKFKIYY